MKQDCLEQLKCVEHASHCLPLRDRTEMLMPRLPELENVSCFVALLISFSTSEASSSKSSCVIFPFLSRDVAKAWASAKIFEGAVIVVTAVWGKAGG